LIRSLLLVHVFFLTDAFLTAILFDTVLLTGYGSHILILTILVLVLQFLLFLLSFLFVFALFFSLLVLLGFLFLIIRIFIARNLGFWIFH
jgi:hypothetical protein